MHHVAPCRFLFLAFKNLIQLFKTVKVIDFYYHINLTTRIIKSKLNLDVIDKLMELRVYNIHSW